MVNILGYEVNADHFFYAINSFIFCVGIAMICVPSRLYSNLNEQLKREYGIKRRITPLEEMQTDIIDRMFLKYRFILGIIVVIVAVALFLSHAL